MSDSLTKGKEVRAELFGAERVQQAFAPGDELNQKFQRLITAACFGEVWGDDSIPRSERSLMTMAIVGAQHRFTEFELHVRLALKNGCTPAQITQLVQHLTVYCGVPTGGEAFRIAQRVLAEPRG